MIEATTKLEDQFKEIESRYKDIAGILKGVFEDKLGIQNIGYSRILYRVKTWKSFLDKIKRKKYTNPISDIEDICGFRIIVRNNIYINQIIKILKEEFDVHDFQDKENDLDIDQFGYRSHHLIVSIKNSWKAAPEYRNVEDMKFEIQVRSELMDAWANISHQIFYKQENLSKEINRKLFRLSALMEIADSEFSNLIKINEEVKNYREDEIIELQTILDNYLPDRKKSQENPMITLLEEMDRYNFTTESLIYLLKNKKEELFQIEEDAFSEAKQLPNVESKWWQIGVVRGFMYLTINDYWVIEGTKYSDHFVSVIEKHRVNFK